MSSGKVQNGWGIQINNDQLVRERLERWDQAVEAAIWQFLIQYAAKAIKFTPVDTGALIRSSRFSQPRIGSKDSSVKFEQTNIKETGIGGYDIHQYSALPDEEYEISQVKNPHAEQEWFTKAISEMDSDDLDQIARAAWDGIDGDIRFSDFKSRAKSKINEFVSRYDGSGGSTG